MSLKIPTRRQMTLSNWDNLRRTYYKQTGFRVRDRIVPESRVNNHETVTIAAPKGTRVKRSYQNSHSVGKKLS